MAGVLKARDAGGAVQTITDPQVRDAAGTLQPLAFIRVRDAASVLQEVFTSGGGGGNPTSITPGSRTFSGPGYFKSASFTAVSSGGVPSSYSWGLLDGDGSVTAGGSTATATLQVFSDKSTTTTSTFFCDMVIAAITYRATCSFEYTNTSVGGGGGSES